MNEEGPENNTLKTILAITGIILIVIMIMAIGYVLVTSPTEQPPIVTPTPEPTAMPTEAPTVTPSPSPKPSPNSTVTPSPSPTVIQVINNGLPQYGPGHNEPATQPTAQPTVTPTPVPTPSPSPSPTPVPVAALSVSSWELDKTSYGNGETLTGRAIVVNDGTAPASGSVKFTAMIYGVDASVEGLQPGGSVTVNYNAPIIGILPGEYDITVTATYKGQTIGSQAFHIRIT
jgi:hypothetical protein